MWIRSFIGVLITVGLGLCFGKTYSQQSVVNGGDDFYREDQFYLGSTYNLWLNVPESVSQRNFSYGIMAGFIRDMPINLSRTVSVGFGMGYAYNNYYSNLQAVRLATGFDYVIPEADFDYKRNKLDMHMLEFPIEFRWRNSSPIIYSFWRVYAGVKMGYNLHSRSKIVSSTSKESFSNSDVKNWHYGLTLSAGYNAFTLHVYYGLSTIFTNEATTSGTAIQLKPLRFGLIFYIL